MARTPEEGFRQFFLKLVAEGKNIFARCLRHIGGKEV